MNKPVFVDQPGWLGDIIFVMSIAQKYASMGHDVYYPVYDNYLKIPSIKKNFPEINFSSVKNFPNYKKYYGMTITEDSDYIFLPFVGNFNKYKHTDHMRYKYELLGYSLDMWRDVKITRDYDAENKLMNELNISYGEKYNLINQNYSTIRKITGSASFVIDNNFRNINMKILDGYNLFDWMGIIERATTIHTIHTSIQYILDVMLNITEELHIYPRTEIGESHSKYDYIFTKKYEYH